MRQFSHLNGIKGNFETSANLDSLNQRDLAFSLHKTKNNPSIENTLLTQKDIYE